MSNKTTRRYESEALLLALAGGNIIRRMYELGKTYTNLHMKEMNLMELLEGRIAKSRPQPPPKPQSTKPSLTQKPTLKPTPSQTKPPHTKESSSTVISHPPTTDLAVLQEEEDDYVDVVPINSSFPIIDWEFKEDRPLKGYTITRSDFSTMRFGTFEKVLKSISRDDLVTFYNIAMKKFAPNPLKPRMIEVVLEWLNAMFDPSSVHPNYFISLFKLDKWEYYESSGTYSLMREYGNGSYHLDDVSYPFTSTVLHKMLKRGLSKQRTTQKSLNLEDSIRKQLEKELRKRAI